MKKNNKHHLSKGQPARKNQRQGGRQKIMKGNMNIDNIDINNTRVRVALISFILALVFVLAFLIFSIARQKKDQPPRPPKPAMLKGGPVPMPQAEIERFFNDKNPNPVPMDEKEIQRFLKDKNPNPAPENSE